MAQNHSELIFLVPWFVLISIAISMFVQGWMVMNAHYGYSKSPKIKHPEMNDVKAGDSLMSIKILSVDDLGDSEYDDLYRRIEQQKLQELFEEPSSYEDDPE